MGVIPLKEAPSTLVLSGNTYLCTEVRSDLVSCMYTFIKKKQKRHLRNMRGQLSRTHNGGLLRLCVLAGPIKPFVISELYRTSGALCSTLSCLVPFLLQEVGCAPSLRA